MATNSLTCAPLFTGGYETDFVESIPDSLSCPICILPFRDPHLVSCCGAKFCEPCIGRVKAAGQPCPLCKQAFNSMLDRSFQRKVLEKNVRCSNKKDGCHWVGELRHLANHERECEWAVVECSYHCGAKLLRRLMNEHEQETCPRRPTDVRLENFVKKMEVTLMSEREQYQRDLNIMKEQHKTEMEAVREELEKMKDEYTIKIQNMEVRMRKMEEEIIPQMRGYPIRTHPVPSVEFIMPHYSAHKKNKEEWFSSPFYTGREGYKMCLRVDAYGNGSGAGTHVSVFFFLMKGEYDSALAWPFEGDITIQLLNHNNDRDHYEYTESFSDTTEAAGGISYRVLSGERAKHGWGNRQFISHSMVKSSAENRRYLVNDCLTFRVTKIVLNSHLQV